MITFVRGIPFHSKPFGWVTTCANYAVLIFPPDTQEYNLFKDTANNETIKVQCDSLQKAAHYNLPHNLSFEQTLNDT